MDKLQTFVLVHDNNVISPALVTIREYGRWFEKSFDEYTSQMELYMSSVKAGGERVLEWHPGTRIGKYFDSNKFSGEQYKCWYILQDSTMMDKLKKYGMAEYRDAIPIAVNDEQGRRMLRVYTVNQIEVYIRAQIDRNARLDVYKPKQIKILDSDFGKLIMPKVEHKKRKLF